MDQRHDGAVGADDHYTGEENDIQPVFDYLRVSGEWVGLPMNYIGNAGVPIHQHIHAASPIHQHIHAASPIHQHIHAASPSTYHTASQSLSNGGTTGATATRRHL